MKKSHIAGLLMLLPLTLLTACGGETPALSFNANWYRNTALKSDIQNTYEQLEYEVTFDSTPQDGFSVNYSGGVYKTELKDGPVMLEGGQMNGYIYTTDLRISVSFSLDGKTSETFEDSVHTEIEFLSAAEGLKPVKSFREVVTHSPITNTPNRSLSDPLSSCYAAFHNSYLIEYNDALTSASVTSTDYNSFSTPHEEKNDYKLGGNGTFLDNEQLTFALRGLNLFATSSFRTFDLVNRTWKNVQLPAASGITESVNFEMDGVPVQTDIEACAITVGYAGDYGGQAQVMVLAKTMDANANTYRNVMLRLESPVIYSLGTLRYKLVKATFANK